VKSLQLSFLVPFFLRISLIAADGWEVSDSKDEFTQKKTVAIRQYSSLQPNRYGKRISLTIFVESPDLQHTGPQIGINWGEVMKGESAPFEIKFDSNEL